MPYFYGKQPNGRYFRYSSIVDSFTAMNLTREEALAQAIREAGEDTGTRKLERADRDEMAESYQPKATPGLCRWTGCVESMIRLKARWADDDPRREAKERELDEVLAMIRECLVPESLIRG